MTPRHLICVIASCCFAAPVRSDVSPATPFINAEVPHFDNLNQYDDTERKSIIDWVKISGPTLSWPELEKPLPLSSFLGPKAFEWISPPDDIRGRIVSLPVAVDNSGMFNIFSFQFVQPKVGNGRRFLSSYYRTEKAATGLISPQFSPDGKTVLFRMGLPPDDIRNSSLLFIWDSRTSELNYLKDEAEEGINLPKVLWSPGGRYLSYLRGGNTYGGWDDRMAPYQLCVRDLENSNERSVLAESAMHWSWCWNGHILASQIPTESLGPFWKREVRPDVLEINPATSEKTTLIEGGTYAQCAPNNEWIAFCDWPGRRIVARADPKSVGQDRLAPVQRGLYLWNRKTGQRKFVGNLQLNYAPWPTDAPSIQWSMDSQMIYVLECLGGGGKVDGQLYKVDVNSQKMQVLTKFTINRPIAYFAIKSISPDGRKLYCESYEGIEGPKGYANSRRTLTVVDTASGHQSPIAQLTNLADENTGWDWHDDSPSPGISEEVASVERRQPAFAKK